MMLFFIEGIETRDTSILVTGSVLLSFPSYPFVAMDDEGGKQDYHITVVFLPIVE